MMTGNVNDALERAGEAATAAISSAAGAVVDPATAVSMATRGLKKRVGVIVLLAVIAGLVAMRVRDRSA